MRVAVTTERPLAVTEGSRRLGGSPVVDGWAGRLVRTLPEHHFSFLAAAEATEGGAPPRGAARARALAAYEALLHALVGQQEGLFAPALRALAGEAGAGGLPALLRSAAAERMLEGVWRRSTAEGASGEPTVRDALHAAALLERCLRPLSGPWYGRSGGRPAEAEPAAADLCHVVGGGLAPLPALVARWAFGTPLVVTEFRPELRERLAALSASPLRRPVRALLATFFRLLARETYRQAGVVTAGSEYVARWQRRIGAEAGRLEVVPEGLPLAECPAAGPEPGRPVLLCAAPLGEGPALEDLLRAFALVRQALPQCALLFAGPGADCRAGTVVVLPEHDRPEGAGLARAMLSGRAVVATDVGTGRELLGPWGLLVPPRDPAALAAACTALLRDEERRTRLGSAARLRARERWDAEAGTDSFRALYLRLVAHSGAYPSPVPAAGVPRLFARPVEFWLGAAVGGEGR